MSTPVRTIRLNDEEWEKVKGYVKEVRGGVVMQTDDKKPPPSAPVSNEEGMAETVDAQGKKISELEARNGELEEKLEQCEAANRDLQKGPKPTVAAAPVQPAVKPGSSISVDAYSQPLAPRTGPAFTKDRQMHRE